MESRVICRTPSSPQGFRNRHSTTHSPTARQPPTTSPFSSMTEPLASPMQPLVAAALTSGVEPMGHWSIKLLEAHSLAVWVASCPQPNKRDTHKKPKSGVHRSVICRFIGLTFLFAIRSFIREKTLSENPTFVTIPTLAALSCNKTVHTIHSDLPGARRRNTQRSKLVGVAVSAHGLLDGWVDRTADLAQLSHDPIPIRVTCLPGSADAPGLTLVAQTTR